MDRASGVISASSGVIMQCFLPLAIAGVVLGGERVVELDEFHLEGEGHQSGAGHLAISVLKRNLDVDRESEDRD